MSRRGGAELADAVTVRPVRVDWLYNFRQRQDIVPAKSLPLHLLFVATSRGEGGIERHSVQLAEHLAKRGVSITYACCPGGTLDRMCVSKKIETYPLKTCNSGDLLSVLTLTRLILRRSINVVHVHSRRDFVISVLAMTCVRFLRHPRGGLPVLVLHAHLLKNMGAPVRLSGRFFECGAQAVIAVSEATRSFLIATHRFRPAFISLIHNGVDISRYELLPSTRRKYRGQMRQQWSIPKGDLVIGMIGRLSAKGQREMLAAAARLVSRFAGIHFVFVGPEGETGVLVSLLQDAEAAGIAAYVVFTGQSENVPMMLAGMDILAHLPEDEAFGLVLVEAMAAGLPVVATDVGGCREVIEDGVTGLLVGVKDENSLIRALSFLLDPDAGPLRQRMGLAGQRRARQMFSIGRQVESLEAHYHDLLRDAA